MGFIWFCAAGYSLFCGIALLALAMLFSILFKQLRQKLLVCIATIIGVFLIILSAAPQTVTSAIHQANQVYSENAIVLLEIGGNDLFDSTPYSQFKGDLSQILSIVSDHKSTVVMLELPILP